MRKGKKRCGLLALLVFTVSAAVASAQNIPYSQSNTGTIDADGEAVQINAVGLAGLGVDIRGTFTGTLAAQCSINGTDWLAVRMTPPNSTTAVTSTTSPGMWTGALVGGCRYARVAATAAMTGSATVVLRGVQASPGGGGGGAGGGTSDTTEATQLNVLAAVDGLEKVEDAVAGSAFTGVGILAVRQDSHVDLAADGDFIPPTIDADGGLRVSIVAGAGSGGTAAADDADFTAGTTSGTPAQGVYESTPTSVTDGDLGTIGITLKRAVRMALENAAGTAAFGTAGTAATPVLTVQGIASMTALSVQSNSANIATEATLSTVSGTLSDIEAALSPDAVHDNAVIATGPGIQLEAKDIDAGALPNAVAEGDSVRAAATLSGAMLSTIVNEAGTVDVGANLNAGVQFEDFADVNNTGVYVVGTVRRDTAASSASATAEFATLNTDGLGRTWVRQGDPCADYARVTTVKIDTAASGNVELVALNGSDIIYVCGYTVVASAATSFQLIYGTGTACATDETDLTGPMALAINGGAVEPNTGSVQYKTAAGSALCLENSGTNQLSGAVKYVRTAAP